MESELERIRRVASEQNTGREAAREAQLERGRETIRHLANRHLPQWVELVGRVVAAKQRSVTFYQKSNKKMFGYKYTWETNQSPFMTAHHIIDEETSRILGILNPTILPTNFEYSWYSLYALLVSDGLGVPFRISWYTASQFSVSTDATE